MNQEIFLEKLLDSTDEIKYIQEEVDETIAMVKSRNVKIKSLEGKVKKLKKPKKIRDFVKELTLKRIVKAALRKVKESLKGSSKKKVVQDKLEFTGVSVIIPTYKPNDYLNDAVESVLNQNCKDIKLEVVIGVNGGNQEYHQQLKSRYSSDSRVQVCYTEKSGVSAGRNNALKSVQYSHVMFLDDDDIYSPGYIGEMVKRVDAKTEFVQGRFFDEGTEDGTVNYINTCIERINSSKTVKRNHLYSSIYSTVTGKLLSRKYLLEKYHPFCEELMNSEDVYYWAENYKYISGEIHCFEDTVEEYYIRRTQESSLSKPSEENEFKYWILDRLQLLEKLEKVLLQDDLDVDAREFVMRFILTQNDFMHKYYKEASDENKEKARKAINEYKGFYVKKMLFSEKKGIAFCYNFPPLVDTSSYVAARRLRQINQKEEENINWTVLTKDSNGSHDQDNQFKRYYSDFLCSEYMNVGGKFSFAVRQQFSFAKRAIHRARHMEADIIYSRSMHPASHLVAYMYKKEHPEVKWYAEFSDPISRTADLIPRKEVMQGQFTGEEEYLIELYDICERVVYELADQIIFTNAVQHEYMLSYNPFTELNDSIRERSLVWHHPIIDKELIKVGYVSYQYDTSKINVGYFGRFYANRSADDMLALLKNKDVCIHIFALNPKDIKELESDRVKVNKAQPYLNFLNIASKMDYVFLGDMNSEAGIIPWLPSKLSDYIASGAKIIGKYIDGSPMSMLEHEKLIKVKEITEEFALTLKKGE